MSQPLTYQEYSLISEVEASQSKLSFAYIIGFLLADGSFQISLQKNNTFRSKYMIITKLAFSQNINTEKSQGGENSKGKKISFGNFPEKTFGFFADFRRKS